MATRFRLHGLTAAPVTPVANGSWPVNGSAVYRMMSPFKVGTPQVQGSTISWTAGAGPALDRVYVSARLRGAQTISGTIKAYGLAKQSASSNARTHMEVYVVSGDGTTVRGTLLTVGHYGNSTNLNTTNRDIAFAISGTALSSVNAQAGDRIVVCLGYADASGTTPSASTFYGDDTNVADVAENETATTGDAWVEFSGTLAFYQPQPTFFERWTTATSGSHTPTVGRYQIVAVYTTSALNVTPNTPTLSTTTGLTFDQLGHIANPTINAHQNAEVTLFGGLAQAGVTAGTITVSIGGQTLAGSVWIEVDGLEVSGTNGANARRNEVDAANANLTGAQTLTLNYGTTPALDSLLLSIWGQTPSPGTFTPRSGWGSFDLNNSSPSMQIRPDGNDSAASGTTSAGGVLVGIAIELVPSAENATAAVTFDDMTSTGAVQVEVQATGATTFADMSSSGAATVLVQATGAVTFADMVASGAAGVDVEVSGAIGFADMIGTAHADALVSAVGATTFDEMTGSGSALSIVSAVGAVTFDDMTGAGHLTTEIVHPPGIDGGPHGLDAVGYWG